jgi:DNA-binding NtrC family response regulator
LRRQPFDLVLTDLKMPDLSGIALLEEILRAQPGACVVLMTVYGSIDSAVEAMRKGAFDYLTKPLDREVLLLAVSRAPSAPDWSARTEPAWRSFEGASGSRTS